MAGSAYNPEKEFIKIFGCGRSEIRSDCIMLPSNDFSLFKGLALGKLYRGLFFNVQSSEKISLISLKARSLAGDCVMYLGQSACRRIVLMGSCGGISLGLGERAVVCEAVNLESFSDFLSLGRFDELKAVKPCGSFVKKILSCEPEKLKKARCATLSSFYLQKKHMSILEKKKVDCIDMESSMVFSAAEYCGIKAASVFYCSDEPGRINYYDDFNVCNRNKIKSSRRFLSDMLVKVLRDE